MRSVFTILATFSTTSVLAQTINYKDVKPYQPGTESLGRDPNPTAWEKFTNDPAVQVLVAVLVAAVIGFIWHRKRKT